MIDEDKDYIEGNLAIPLQSSALLERPLNERPAQLARSRNWSRAARTGAVSFDAERETFELEQLWTHARCGRWHFVDTYSTTERHFARVRQLASFARSPVRDRNLGVLREVLLGQPAKAIAIDLGVSVSTVAAYLQDALRALGLAGRVASVPVMLIMAARAAGSQTALPSLARLSPVLRDSDADWLISVRRPDLDFPVPLSRAEAIVVRQLIDGRSYAEISRQRSTSRRTVANQLATAFRKFGVSGRSALIHELIRHSLTLQRRETGIRGDAGFNPACLAAVSSGVVGVDQWGMREERIFKGIGRRG